MSRPIPLRPHRAFVLVAVLATALGAPAPARTSPAVGPGESAGGATGAGGRVAAGGVRFDARAAEHLLSRAGFGARPAEIEAALARGLEATVEDLLSRHDPRDPFFVQRPDRRRAAEFRAMGPEERRLARAQMRRRDRLQMQAYTAWWIEGMLDGVDPLRDRMTLLWSGLFTSSYADVKRSHEMIAQHRLLRDHALESYADMLRGIVHDAAMLRYLNNDQNEKRHPNENLARELMELFSLGEGNYSEKDVQEVARALTGFAPDAGGGFRFRRRVHDFGRKEILGEEGRFDGDDVVRILLRQDACARYIAGRILSYLEGVPPDPRRLERYARLLRREDYALRPFLRTLFTDPAFYRDEVVGARVASPIDFLVGTCRRLGIRPPARALAVASASLGQTLFAPPSVRGWEEGPAWITTGSLLLRGNLAGWLVGAVDLESAFRGGGAGAPSLGPLARRFTDGGADGPFGRGLRPGGRGGREPGRELEEGSEGEVDDAEEGVEDLGGDTDGAMDGGMEPGMEPGMEESAGPAGAATGGGFRPPRLVRDLERALGGPWVPPIQLTWRVRTAGARDAQGIARDLAEELLAIEPPARTVGELARFVTAECAREGIAEPELLDEPAIAEPILRRAAHVLLSWPEAQLH